MTRDEMEKNALVRGAVYERDFIDLLADIASVLPIAHTVFSEEQKLPYAIWNENSGDFIFADGNIVRGYVDIMLEVYTATNDTAAVSEIERILKKHEKLYNFDSMYIEKEKCKMTVFEFTVRKD